jgi:hypothetical protein
MKVKIHRMITAMGSSGLRVCPFCQHGFSKDYLHRHRKKTGQTRPFSPVTPPIPLQECPNCNIPLVKTIELLGIHK